MAELLFWPALLAYGEAALAYAGDVRRPGTAGRLATWGVRLGWLLQTALLIWQATRPWGVGLLMGTAISSIGMSGLCASLISSL